MARTPNAEIARQLEQIEALLNGHPGGRGRAELERAFAEAYGRRLAWRTMLRRLEELEARKRLTPVGEGPNRVYRLSPVQETRPSGTPTPTPLKRAAEDKPVEAEEEYVPLSPEGEELRALVRRPMVARRPIGYQEEFLREYEPGTTWYLTDEHRARLHEMGRTPDADRPAGTFAREVFERLLIDLAWASSRLEGNTYTRLDTKNLLEHGVRAEGANATDAQMILNHKKAIELLVDQAEDVGFNRYTLLNLHAALSENLLDDATDEGRVRSRLVGVTGKAFVPLSIPQKLEELFDLLLAKARDIPDPFEQAFFVMVHLPYLQPFADVNKRTSRLAANIPLIKANLCPLSFVGVPDRAYVEGTLAVYQTTRVELLRDVFLWAYERSCAQYRVVRDSMAEPDPIRLRYRPQLGDLVRDVVLGGKPPRLGDLRKWADTDADPPIPAEDRARFAEIALELLLDLHEGAIARYRVRPSEFAAWRAGLEAARSS
ncbi:MAG: Fic family protein [Gemmatimonadaceae bacterium]